ncbi:MAG: ribose 5-phosphate isomerase B [Candidatus Puniceispirillaceae bacterium]
MAFTKLYLASDHGGLTFKSAIKAHLEAAGILVEDLGPDGTESVDYPDYGARCAMALKDDETAGGIIICGSGIGISIAANRHSWVRAALAHDITTARLSREHNNANILALGERVIGLATALDCVDIFLNTDFEGGRHQRRVDKLTNLPE